MKANTRLLLKIIFLAFLRVNLYAQNLVINPGFEERDSTKMNHESHFGYYGVEGWYDPNLGTDDYFFLGGRHYTESLGKNDIMMKPHSGTSFAGFIEYWNIPYREYIGGELIKPLDKSAKYRFSFYLALSGNSNFYDTQIAVVFSTAKKNQNTDTVIVLSPQLVIDLSQADNAVHKWEEFSGYYIANGGEKYFVIGDFGSSRANSTRVVYPGLSTYYFIDDVSMLLANETDTAKISSGTKLIKNDIDFKLGDSTLNSNSYPALDQIIYEMNNQPTLKVEIDGHTDNSGLAEINQKLSEARARAVANYFVSKGILRKRITTKGFGSSKPISSDQNKNRRVEFIFSN